MEINERHFPLLRLAQLRQLKVRRLGRGVWAVSSHSRRGHWHKVAAGVCSCAAVDYCSHIALALDSEVKRDADVPDYLSYMDAARESFKELELRVLQGNTTAEDRAFVKPLIEKVRQKQPAPVKPEPAGVPF